jgi:hypothetical protein
MTASTLCNGDGYPADAPAVTAAILELRMRALNVLEDAPLMCCAYLASSWSIAFDPRQPGARTRMRQCKSSLGADLENLRSSISFGAKGAG